MDFFRLVDVFASLPVTAAAQNDGEGQRMLKRRTLVFLLLAFICFSILLLPFHAVMAFSLCFTSVLGLSALRFRPQLDHILETIVTGGWFLLIQAWNLGPFQTTSCYLSVLTPLIALHLNGTTSCVWMTLLQIISHLIWHIVSPDIDFSYAKLIALVGFCASCLFSMFFALAHYQYERDLQHRLQTLQYEKSTVENLASTQSQFLAHMSHELKTPLHGIIGMTDLLLETSGDSVQLKSSQTILSCATDLLILIDGILQFCSLEQHHVSLNEESFELGDFLVATGQLLRETAANKNLEILLRIPQDDFSSTLRRHHYIGDTGKLRQVMINLIGNSIKFSDGGAIVVTVQTAPADTCTTFPDKYSTPDFDLVRFTVKDQGIGIAPDKMPRLFQEFSQADNQISRRYGGTGLGLAISRMLVNLFHGKITLESAGLGQGCTAIVEVPLRKAGTLVEDTQQDLFSAPELNPALFVRVTDVCVRDQVTKAFPHNVSLNSLLDDASWTFLSKSVAVLLICELDKSFSSFVQCLGTKTRDTQRLGIICICSLAEMSQARRHSENLSTNRPTIYISKPFITRNLLEAFCELKTRLAQATPADNQPSYHLNDALATRLPVFKNECNFRNLRVLAADDNAVNRKILQRQLESLQIETEMVCNGEEAIDIFRQQHDQFDMIMLDLHMAVVDGITATAAIRELETRWNRRIPIIALTADSTSAVREAVFAAGGDALLLKPISRKQLKELIFTSVF